MAPSDPSDPLATAVEIAEIKGSLALLKEQISTGLKGITKSIDSIQSDQRQTTSLMIELGRHQQTMEATSSGLTRAFKAIEDLAREFSGWRKEHEVSDEATKTSVTSFKGALRGVVVSIAFATILGGALVTLALYTYHRDVSDMSTSIIKLETKHDHENSMNRSRIERLEELRNTR